eukprot:6491780-Amphidinium_carterae.2
MTALGVRHLVSTLTGVGKSPWFTRAIITWPLLLKLTSVVILKQVAQLLIAPRACLAVVELVDTTFFHLKSRQIHEELQCQVENQAAAS